jgi:IclR family acetate operon transcriptional repressor
MSPSGGPSARQAADQPAIQTGRSRGRPRGHTDKSEQMVIQSLDRAVSLLKVLANGGAMALTEVAEASNQTASTAYRILLTYQKQGIVDYDDVAQVWFVGIGAFRIGSAFLSRTGLMERARTAMQHVMAETGETANLAIIDGGEVIFVSQVETHEPIRAFFRPGTRSAIHSSGIGKALMAFLPRERIDEIVEVRGLPSFTNRTISNRDHLLAELAQIRRRGWAIDNEERTEGMRCIAAPIFNPYGEPVAGISISGPAVRVRPDRDAKFGGIIAAAAAEVTRAIGGNPPAPEAISSG